MVENDAAVDVQQPGYLLEHAEGALQNSAFSLMGYMVAKIEQGSLLAGV